MIENGARPGFQFHVGDWLRNPAIRSVSEGARLLYVELMCRAHLCVPYGHLRLGERILDASTLASMVGLGHARKSYLGRVAELKAVGLVQEDAQGALYLPLLVRQEEIRLRRAAGGMKSVEHPNTPKPKADG